MALSASDRRMWQIHERQLLPHTHSYLDLMVANMFSFGPQLMIARILTQCGWLLHRMRDDVRLDSLLSDIVAHMKLDSLAPCRRWLSLYDLRARNYLNIGKARESVQQLELVVKIEEQSLAEDHPDRLASQHELARAYHTVGYHNKAVALMEVVVRVKQKTMTAEHPSRLVSERVLAWFCEG